MTDYNKPPMLGTASSVTAMTPSPLIVVATCGTEGDMVPFITLAQGLRERGHRVLMLVPGFQEALTQAAGVPYQTFGSPEEGAILNNPNLWSETKGLGVIWRGLVPHLDALREIIRHLPADETCVVLSHLILVPMAALARSVRSDLRIVSAYLAPSNLCSSHDTLTVSSLRIPPWVPVVWLQALWGLIHKHWFNPRLLPSLNAARTQHGLTQVPHFFEHIWKEPDASVGLFPKWLGSMQPDWPQPFLEGDFVSATTKDWASLPPEVEQFLSDGDPPIVFTPGTGHQHIAFYFNTALKTLEQLGRRGLFVTPHVTQLPDPLPSNVLWQSHVPFASLLPYAAAVVHHGGIGTTARAFRAGIPQLIMPYAYDQFDNAFRAKRSGVADVLLAKHLSVARMHRKLAHMLTSQKVQQACSDVAQKMDQRPGSSWLLDRVEAALLGSSFEESATN